MKNRALRALLVMTIVVCVAATALAYGPDWGRHHELNHADQEIDAIDVLTQVEAFYRECWWKLIWFVGGIGAVIAVGVPLLIGRTQRTSLGVERESIIRDVKAERGRETKRVTEEMAERIEIAEMGLKESTKGVLDQMLGIETEVQAIRDEIESKNARTLRLVAGSCIQQVRVSISQSASVMVTMSSLNTALGTAVASEDEDSIATCLFLGKLWVQTKFGGVEHFVAGVTDGFDSIHNWLVVEIRELLAQVRELGTVNRNDVALADLNTLERVFRELAETLGNLNTPPGPYDE